MMLHDTIGAVVPGIVASCPLLTPAVTNGERCRVEKTLASATDRKYSSGEVLELDVDPDDENCLIDVLAIEENAVLDDEVSRRLR